MARMILALSAVFFFISPAILRAEFVHSFKVGFPQQRNFLVPDNTLFLEVWGRSVSCAASTASLSEVTLITRELFARYPQLKFAYCVTNRGDLFVVEESMLSWSSGDFVCRALPNRPNRENKPIVEPPLTAFHIASMTHAEGYFQLPRPVPVAPPSIVFDQNNQQGAMPGPQGQLRPSVPSSPWRTINNPANLSYILVFGLPPVVIGN